MHSGIPGRSRSSLGRRGLPQVAAGGKEVPQGRGATLPMWKWPTKPGQTCLSSLWVEQGTCMCAHDQLDSSARLPCAQTTHVNGSYETTHQLGSRTFCRPQQASPHTCARESCILFTHFVNDSNGQSGALACVAPRSFPGGSSREAASSSRPKLSEADKGCTQRLVGIGRGPAL